MNVSQALEFADDGWAVLPLRIDKRPLLPEGEHKKYLYQAASTEEVKAFWERFPDANVGLACGKVSGRTVVDIDDGKDVFPDTRTVQTPSGGTHKIYQYSATVSNAVGSYYPGIDIRNDGGYIVAAGSHCEYTKKGKKISGDYVVIDDGPSRAFPDALFTHKQSAHDKFNPEKLMGAKEGNRNEVAASVIGLLVSGKSKDIQVPLWELTKAWNSKCDPPLEENELLTTFNSITAREWAKPQNDIKLVDGLKIAKVSRDYIVEVPLPNGRVNVTFSEIMRSRQSFDAVVSVQLIHNTDGKLPAFEQRLDMNSASAISNLCTALNSAYGNKKDGYNWVLILNRAGMAIKKNIVQEKKPLIFSGIEKYKASTYMVEHFLEDGSPTLVHGDGSTGKSYLCLYLAVCASLRRDFLGKKTESFKTLYLDMEATSAKLLNRLHRIANGLNVSFATLADHIHWYKPDGSVANEQEIIARMVEDGGYRLVIVDAGASASGGSPMDEQAVLKLFTALDHVPCAKLVIHHEPKNVEGLGDDKAYYGTTFWRNAPRLAWRLKREEKDGNKSVIKATHHKANDDSESTPIMYSMEFSDRDALIPTVKFEIENDFKPSDESQILSVLSDGAAEFSTILSGTTLTRGTLQNRIDTLMNKGTIEREKQGKKYLYYVPKNDTTF